MSMFANIVEKASKFKNQLTQEIEDRISLAESYGDLWEPSENVEKCRGCAVKFQLPFMNRKHHCRICAGVFCDTCCFLPDNAGGLLFGGAAKPNTTAKLTNARVNASRERERGSRDKEKEKEKEGEETASNMRICDGCKRGETPGESIRKHIKQQLEMAKDQVTSPKKRRDKQREEKDSQNTVSALDRLSMMVAVRVGENVGVQFAETHPSESVKLLRGSAYGEDNNPVSTSKPVPNSGYFEIANKCKTEFFCVKLLRKGGDQKFEVPRPSYIAVPPGGSVHAFFNEDEDEDVESNNLEIIILHDNHHKIPSDSAHIIYDTTLIASSKKISACAKIENFKDCIFYTVESQNKNVLLKYKGSGVLDVRMGNGVKRVGIIGAIQGLRHAKDKIDFGTNVHSVETAFTFST